MKFDRTHAFQLKKRIINDTSVLFDYIMELDQNTNSKPVSVDLIGDFKKQVEDLYNKIDDLNNKLNTMEKSHQLSVENRVSFQERPDNWK
jgi:hypothetical protein